jgi:hypothetical protein
MTGTSLARLALLTLLLAAPQVLRAQTCSLAALQWMAGTWLNSANPSGAQERWAVAPGDVLMGSGWEFPPGKTGYAEFMTIRSDGPTIALFLRHFGGDLARAWEEPTAPMVFNASDCADHSVLFNGQGEHAGERMRYSRSGDALTIVADFLHHGTPQHVEWHMTRSPDPG